MKIDYTVNVSALISGKKLDLPSSTLIEQIDRALENNRAKNLIFSGGVAVTGEQIITASHRLARQIMLRSRSQKGIVAVNLNRSVDLICTTIAILRLGCVYLPISNDQPYSRNVEIIDDADPILVVFDSHDGPCVSGDRYCSLDLCSPDVESHEKASYPEIQPTDICYVMYTSGSTGNPKGVPITHQGILNRLMWMKEYYQFGAQDALICKTPLSFDVSIYEIFFPLLTGSRIIICESGKNLNIEYIIDLIIEYKVTYLQFVPQLLKSFVKNKRARQCVTVKHLISSGDKLDITLARDCWNALPDAKLYNGYGPTEASIGVCHWEYEDRDDLTLPPIGYPIFNVDLLIMNGQRPSGLMETGELWISGVQLSPGYLNKPLGDPINSVYVDVFVSGLDRNVRFYRTGDLVRLNTLGEIEYLGRVDNQIKVNGTRFELEEIESVINSKEEIERSMAIYHAQNPSAGITVLYEKKSGRLISKTDLLVHCMEHLPAQVIPHNFVMFNLFVMNTNGKIDRKATAEKFRSLENVLVP